MREWSTNKEIKVKSNNIVLGSGPINVKRNDKYTIC